MNTLYNFPNIPELADKWIELSAKPPTKYKIIGLSTVQKGDFIASALKQKEQRNEEIRKIFQKSDDECLRDLYNIGGIKWPMSEDWK